MAEAGLGMPGMNTAEKILKGRLDAAKLTGNDSYPNPSPAIVQVTDSATHWKQPIIIRGQRIRE